MNTSVTSTKPQVNKVQLLTDHSGLEPIIKDYHRVLPNPDTRPHTHVNYYCVAGAGVTYMTYGLFHSAKINQSSMMIPSWETFEEVSK